MIWDWRRYWHRLYMFWEINMQWGEEVAYKHWYIAFYYK